jgi:hypothetical protein
MPPRGRAGTKEPFLPDPPEMHSGVSPRDRFSTSSTLQDEYAGVRSPVTSLDLPDTSRGALSPRSKREVLSPHTHIEYDPHMGRSRRLHGPGPPYCGKAILSFAPSRDETTSQKLEGNTFTTIMCCSCLPMWARALVFLGCGLLFLGIGSAAKLTSQLISGEHVKDYYLLDNPSRAGFVQWRHGDPHCGAPGGRYLKVYMFHLVNPVALSAGPPPEVEQRGPYVYRVGWNYSQFNWSQSWSSSADNVSFVAEEQLTFCPGLSLGAGGVPLSDTADPISNYDSSGSTPVSRTVQDWVRGSKPGATPAWAGVQHNLYLPSAVAQTAGAARALPGGVWVTTTRNITIHTGGAYAILTPVLLRTLSSTDD